MSLHLGPAFKAMASGDVAFYVGVSAIAQLVVSFIIHFVWSKPIGAEKEMQTNPIFRSVQDPRMLYPLLGSPFVRSGLDVFLAMACFGENAVRSWAPENAVSFCVLVWFCNAFHGIFLDYSCLKMTWRTPLNWWMGSFLSSVVSGYVMGYVL